LKKSMNWTVFLSASAIIVLFLLVGAINPEGAEKFFASLQTWISDNLGWLYVLSVGGFLFSVIFLAVSRYGKIRLGPDDSRPDFSYLSWIAMLFAAGMGIGLMFFAVAEPIQHYAHPPEASPLSLEAARQAMVITFFHWGIHAWGVYAVVGLSLAYFSFRYNLPLTIRSGLYPLFGERIKGSIGNIVDVFAIVSTVFGIATSLGLGVLQIDAGLGYLFGMPQEVWFQLILIFVVIGMATLSVVSGLDKGVRRLSELNLILALVLMLFVLFAGPTSFLLKAFVQNIGNYLDKFFIRTFNLYAYEPRNWMGSWTLFYWAWWIAWSPFVGMFIARISRGRTIREFATGVLLVPTTLTFFWMTVFGNTAIWLDQGKAAGAVSRAVAENVPVALFQFLEQLPYNQVTSILAVLLVVVFFVTSADSGSLVVDTIASGGATDSPVWQRVYWCAMEGITAALLLLTGGLAALQSMTIVAALPFTLVMILLLAGLIKGVKADVAIKSTQKAVNARPTARLPWRQRLAHILHEPKEIEIKRFIVDVVEPALHEVAEEMQSRGQKALLAREEDGAVVLTVVATGVRSFVYGVRPAKEPIVAFSPSDVIGTERRRPYSWLARTEFSDGSLGYDILGLQRGQIIDDALNQYEQYRALVQSAAASLFVRSPDSPG